MLTKRQRLDTAVQLQEPDRTPTLGGWLASPRHVSELAGASEEDYWNDPIAVSIRAYEALDVDGLIGFFVPKNRDDFRCVDGQDFKSGSGGMTLQDALDMVDAMPGPEQIERGFDFAQEFTAFKKGLREQQARCGEIVWMPAQWRTGAWICWYHQLGYENFFTMVAAYPDRAQKLVEIGGAQGYCRSRLVAAAVKEGLIPAAVLLGEDICSQRGPMISPKFLERYYAPQLAYGLKPLLEAGCRPVWHCDGDVRPLLDMLFDAGVQGLQGFQPECGMHLEELINRRTRDGEPLLIFGPISVTGELPRGTPDEIAASVRRAIEICRGKASLVLFTANTINPDVPLENIRAMYQAVKL